MGQDHTSLTPEHFIVIPKTVSQLLVVFLMLGGAFPTYSTVLSQGQNQPPYLFDNPDSRPPMKAGDEIAQDLAQYTITSEYGSPVPGAVADSMELQDQTQYTFEEHHMGTLFKITIYAESDSIAEIASTNAFLEIDQLNTIMSDYLEDSELNRFSRTSGTGSFVRLSEPLFDILRRSQWFSYQTDGMFDVTVGAMTKSWRKLRATPEPTLPTAEELKNLKNRTGYQHLILRHDTHSAMLEKPGMELDLGGIAKGYASARALETLESFGISSALIDAGGDITLGDAPAGWTVWSIAVPKPAATHGEIDLLTLHATHATVATSGSLFQYVEIDGVRYSHVLNPETGLGATDQIQATVISHSAAAADALASALTLMKPEDGLRLVEQLPDTEAFIFKQINGSVKEWSSSGVQTYLEN